MYYKKSIILTEERKKTPPIKAQISYNGDFFSVNLPVGFAIVCLSIDSKPIFAKSETSTYTFNLPFSENFCIGAFSDGLFYYGFSGIAPLSRTQVKNKHLDSKVNEVNKPYDDYAISTENYFEYNNEKEATLKPIICEKGHLLKENNKNINQQFTIYPQYVKNEEAMEDVKNNDFYKVCNATENQEKICTKEATSCRTNPKNEDGISTKSNSESFYKKIESDLHSLFCRFPKEEKLEAIIPNSTFVKIDYDKDKFYVTGLTTFNGKAEYVVFGVYAKEGNEPKELKNFGYFAPCFENGDGYYLIYQDALTGKILSPC